MPEDMRTYIDPNPGEIRIFLYHTGDHLSTERLPTAAEKDHVRAVGSYESRAFVGDVFLDVAECANAGRHNPFACPLPEAANDA